MAREVKLTDPLPFLFYPDGERIFYLSPGPAVLLFAIAFKDIVRNNLISEQPVMQPAKHPFASVTGVCSFADDVVRRAFGAIAPGTGGPAAAIEVCATEAQRITSAVPEIAAAGMDADKAAVITAVRARGFDPADDNEADALAILLD